jgi:hypothetical protein
MDLLMDDAGPEEGFMDPNGEPGDLRIDDLDPDMFEDGMPEDD